MRTNASAGPASARLRPARLARNASLSVATALALAATAAAAPPVNDNFAAAIELTGDSGSLAGNTNLDATREAGEPDCVYAATTNTVWFKWTCTEAGSLIVDTTGSVNQAAGEWDACIALYTGSSLATLTKVVQQDEGVPEQVSLQVTPGIYHIQLGGYYAPSPDVATNLKLAWSFSTVPVVDISGNLNDTLDAVVGAGNSARLTADTKTFWPGTTSTSNVNLNGFKLTLDNGGGNAQTYNGALTGPGVLQINGRYAADWDPDIRLGGTAPNTPTSVFLNTGRVTLNKSPGIDALAGPITMSTGGNTKRIWLQAPDQISDTSTIDSGTGTGPFILSLNGHHEGFASLTIKTGDLVSTGTGGVLNVNSLTVDGNPLPKGAYTAGNSSFVQGTGYIDVDNFGPPVIVTPPAAPASPSPAHNAADVNPAYVKQLTWAVSNGATSYDLYLWEASQPKPVDPTATVLSNEYTLGPDLLSLTACNWQVVAANSVGATPGPTWAFTTVARWEISGNLPNELDTIIGAGNSGLLIGNTQTYWASTNSTSNVSLNGFQLTLDTGNGNAQTYNGTLTGPGTLRINGRYAADWDPDIRLAGTAANTPAAVLISKGRATLNKPAGIDAFAGPVTIGGGGDTKRIWLQNNDQISNASTVDSTASSGFFEFCLNGYNETIAALAINAGHMVNTGNGGVLTVSNLTVAGAPLGAGTYTALTHSGFVSGSGSVVVSGASGSNYDTWTQAKGLAGPSAAFDADPDADGIPNGVEFVCGGEPNPANPGSQLRTGLPDGRIVGGHFVVSFRRMDEAAYLNPVVEFDTDLLAPWTTAADPGNATIEVTPGTPADTVTVRIPMGANTGMFARLSVPEP